MRLELEREELEELDNLIAVSLRELSHEIAATDNATYRAQLLVRRARLRSIAEKTVTMLAPVPDLPGELVRELARPGD